MLIVPTGDPLGKHITSASLTFTSSIPPAVVGNGNGNGGDGAAGNAAQSEGSISGDGEMQPATTPPSRFVLSAHAVTFVDLDCSVERDAAVQNDLLVYQAQIQEEDGSKVYGRLGEAFRGDSLLNEDACNKRSGSERAAFTTLPTTQRSSTSGGSKTVANAGPASSDGGGATNGAVVICGCRVAECGAGKLVADAIQWHTGADFALVNSGAIGATFPAGNITRGNVLTVLPFDDQISMVALTGAQVLAVLQHSITALSVADVATAPDGRFLQLSSNIKVQWRFTAENEIALVTVKLARNRSVAASASTTSGGGGAAGCAGSLAAAPALRSFEDDLVPFDPSAVYCVATSTFLAGGGDGYSMLAAAPSSLKGGSFLDAVGSFIETFAAAADADADANTDAAAFNTDGLSMVAADAASSMVGPRAGSFAQISALVSLQLGLLCIYSTSGGADREECDHMLHTVDLINDKTDGFYDDVLEFAQIDVVEVECGCSDNNCIAAIRDLYARMPMMAAAIGPSCSSDVAAVSNVATRADTGYDGVFISGSSTAPSLANVTQYPSVARIVTNEFHSAAALAEVIRYHKWQNIAIIHDDSVWGSESAAAFISSYTMLNGEAGLEANILNNNSE